MAYSGWEQISMPSGVSLSSEPAVVRDADGFPRIFAINAQDNGLWEAQFHPRTPMPHPKLPRWTWKVVPPPKVPGFGGFSTTKETNKIAVGVNAQGGFEVFVLEMHQGGKAQRPLWHIGQLDDGRWGNWQQLAPANIGFYPSDIAVCSSSQGGVDVFVSDLGGALWCQQQIGTNQSDYWIKLDYPPDLLVQSPSLSYAFAVGLNGNNVQEIIAVGDNPNPFPPIGRQYLYRRVQSAPNSSSWNDWEALGSFSGAQGVYYVCGLTSSKRTLQVFVMSGGDLWTVAQSAPGDWGDIAANGISLGGSAYGVLLGSTSGGGGATIAFNGYGAMEGLAWGPPGPNQVGPLTAFWHLTEYRFVNPKDPKHVSHFFWDWDFEDPNIPGVVNVTDPGSIVAAPHLRGKFDFFCRDQAGNLFHNSE
jgi:hypothetical protein